MLLVIWCLRIRFGWFLFWCVWYLLLNLVWVLLGLMGLRLLDCLMVLFHNWFIWVFWCLAFCFVLLAGLILGLIGVDVVCVRWDFGEFGVRWIVLLGSFALYVFEYLIVRCNCSGLGLGVCVTLLDAVWCFWIVLVSGFDGWFDVGGISDNLMCCVAFLD